MKSGSQAGILGWLGATDQSQPPMFEYETWLHRDISLAIVVFVQVEGPNIPPILARRQGTLQEELRYTIGRERS